MERLPEVVAEALLHPLQAAIEWNERNVQLNGNLHLELRVGGTC
jgi:hypothetical protein